MRSVYHCPKKHVQGARAPSARDDAYHKRLLQEITRDCIYTACKATGDHKLGSCSTVGSVEQSTKEPLDAGRGSLLRLSTRWFSFIYLHGRLCCSMPTSMRAAIELFLTQASTVRCWHLQLTSVDLGAYSRCSFRRHGFLEL